MTTARLCSLAIQEGVDKQQQRDLKGFIQRHQSGSFGPPVGSDAQELDQVGWGIIFAHNADPAIYDALQALRDLRRAKAGDLYRSSRARRATAQLLTILPERTTGFS